MWTGLLGSSLPFDIGINTEGLWCWTSTTATAGPGPRSSPNSPRSTGSTFLILWWRAHRAVVGTTSTSYRPTWTPPQSGSVATSWAAASTTAVITHLWWRPAPNAPTANIGGYDRRLIRHEGIATVADRTVPASPRTQVTSLRVPGFEADPPDHSVFRSTPYPRAAEAV